MAWSKRVISPSFLYQAQKSIWGDYLTVDVISGGGTVVVLQQKKMSLLFSRILSYPPPRSCALYLPPFSAFHNLILEFPTRDRGATYSKMSRDKKVRPTKQLWNHCRALTWLKQLSIMSSRALDIFDREKCEPIDSGGISGMAERAAIAKRGLLKKTLWE